MRCLKSNYCKNCAKLFESLFGWKINYVLIQKENFNTRGLSKNKVLALENKCSSHSLRHFLEVLDNNVTFKSFQKNMKQIFLIKSFGKKYRFSAVLKTNIFAFTLCMHHRFYHLMNYKLFTIHTHHE